MKCSKCGKEMDREDGRATIRGIAVDVSTKTYPVLLSDLEYYTKQLGKYSNGKGECHVAICYECYIDALFQTGGIRLQNG